MHFSLNTCEVTFFFSLYLQWEVCNVQCVHCHVLKHEKNVNIKVEKIQKISNDKNMFRFPFYIFFNIKSSYLFKKKIEWKFNGHIIKFEKKWCTVYNFIFGSQMPDLRTIFVKNVQTCENFFKKVFLSRVMRACYDC